ncbi:MAG: hypothetical protein ACR2MN_02480 [Acidimicrobiales bacterium]
MQGWRRSLADHGEIRLTPFDDAELVAVGASSPILGLVPAASADRSSAEVDSTLRRLRHQGLVRAESDTGQAVLAGDLAGIVAIRRTPALVGIATVRPATVAGPDPPTAAGHSGQTIAVLHGLAREDGGLAAVLEEVVDADGMHHFTLCTPKVAADRLFEAWIDLCADGGPVAVCCHIFAPSSAGPCHLELVVDRGPDGSRRARRSLRGDRWDDESPAGAAGEGWARLFEESVVPLPS